MGILEHNLTQQIVQKLGWTLLHSVWQAGLVALLLVVVLRFLCKSSANLRYVIACLGLVVIVLLPVVTFYVVPTSALTSDAESVPGFPVPVTVKPHEIYNVDMPLQRSAEHMQIFPAISWKQRAMNFYVSALPYIVFGWFIGVLALSLWHLGGWVHLQRLRRKKVNSVDISLQGKLHNLIGRLKVTQQVKLMESALVQIPTVVGWLRPLILMPVSALAGLSPEQLEALLAHELAHIRRYDYLVNIFQTVVETLGFYHPAVWWVSHKIRVERENCCDDLAVSVCSDKVGYARALTSMEEARFAKGDLAVAASGGSLSRRIRRLIGTSSAENKRLGYVPIVISILLVMALMIPTTLAITARRENRDSSPNSTTKSDSIKATDAYIAATDQKNDYDPKYPAADLDETAAKAQILFECKIFEVPIDLRFLEGEHKEDEVSRIVWLGNEYAERLESLCQKTQKAKLLTTPRILVFEGEEASMDLVHRIPYKAGYESTSEGDTEPKPIVKYLFDGIKLKLKGHTVDSSAISTEIRLTQSKTGFTTHKDSQGREIQVPVIASSVCATDVTVPSQTPVIIGGLKSQNNDDNQLLLVITPSIVLPEKDPEKAKADQILADTRLLEALIAKQNLLLKLDEDRKMALEHRILELQQKLYEVQRKLAELEARKSELKGLSVVLASAKEPVSEHERLTVLAEECAERGDFAEAVKYQEKAIELAKAEKDYGIGIAIEKADGLIRIVKVLPDTPASGSSFRRGDIIKAIDGLSTEGMSSNEVVARITGPKGTKVTLTVKSHSQDITMEETFTRQLLLEGSPALQEYEWRLNAYKAGKTRPQYYEMWQKYNDLLKDPNASKAGAPYIFELKYANPEELARLLSRILEHRSKGISDKPAEGVRIVPDPRAKKLIILASPADIRLLEALIAELDITPPLDIATTIDLPRKKPKPDIPAESFITQIFVLKYADCESMVETLKLLFPDDQFRMASDKRTNMLIVVGTESAIKKVRNILSAVDVPGRDADREIKTPENQEKKEY
jgi:beta-lactamase regulating signal transducer with metallopeptidase domain